MFTGIKYRDNYMYIIAITGASGAILGIRLAEELIKAGKEISVIVSDSAWQVIHHELFRNKKRPDTVKDILKLRGTGFDPDHVHEFRNDNFFSPPASGTSFFEALIIMPCSMKTLSGIAAGYADTLINRVADVALKERRRCILVPRETPLNLIHIENMLKAKQAGAEILLPIPGFYTYPETVDDIINFVVGKTLNLLNIKHALFKSWDEQYHSL